MNFLSKFLGTILGRLWAGKPAAREALYCEFKPPFGIRHAYRTGTVCIRRQSVQQHKRQDETIELLYRLIT